MFLHKKILQKLDKYAKQNDYTIYLTNLDKVLYVSDNLPLIKLKPKTDRELLYKMLMMYMSITQSADDFKSFYTTKKSQIIPVYKNDIFENYNTQLILPIYFDDSIFGTVIFSSKKRIDYNTIFTNVKPIHKEIVISWMQYISKQWRKENCEDE